MIRYLPFILILLCASCIQLGGKAEPTKYYLLSPTVENIDASPKQIKLEIASIDFPSYLDRPQLVTRGEDNSIEIAIFNRWAEPLFDNLTRTLQENLYAHFPEASISTGPWLKENVASHTLKIQINRFDGILGKHILADIRWQIYANDSGAQLSRNHFVSKLPIGETHQDLVAGFNRSLAEFSAQIATEINKE